MAVNSIRIPRDPARDARARALVSQVKLWHTGTLKRPWGAFPRGTVYFITLNGHHCNAVFCSCKDYERGHVCKHIRAVVTADAQKVTKPAPKIEDLWPSCDKKGCTDEREPGETRCWRHVLCEVMG